MSAPSTPGSAPKSMSSRLLTMKFMQRAAASPTNASTAPEEPAPKRRKKDFDSSDTPKVDVNAMANQRAIEAAIAAEDAKRQAALERAAAESGDTRWVLSFEDQRASSRSNLALRVVPTGYANLDVPSSVKMEDDDEDKPVMVGRRSFGRFNKALEKKQDSSDESDSGSDDDDEEDSEAEPEDDDPAAELIRSSRNEVTERLKAERRAKKQAEKAEAEKLAKKRKKHENNLNGMTSLSGNTSCFTCGGPHLQKECPKRQNSSKGNVTCFKCGGDHLKRDCPKLKRGHGGGDDGPPRKMFKAEGGIKAR